MKKAVSLFLVLILCATCCLFVGAENVQPRWKELVSMDVALEPYDGLYNNAKVMAYATCMDNEITVNLTVTVTRWDGSKYVDTSKTWSDSGAGRAGISKTFHLGEGNYVARVDVTVYDKNGAFIESEIVYSKELII